MDHIELWAVPLIIIFGYIAIEIIIRWNESKRKKKDKLQESLKEFFKE